MRSMFTVQYMRRDHLEQQLEDSEIFYFEASHWLTTLPCVRAGWGSAHLVRCSSEPTLRTQLLQCRLRGRRRPRMGLVHTGSAW